MKTLIDKRKEQAQILIEYSNGGSFTINAKGINLSGKGILDKYENGFYEVTTKMLNILRLKYKVETNF